MVAFASMTFRRTSLILAILAGLVCVVTLATGDALGTVTSGTCAVLFGLQASGRELFPGLKKLREVLRDRRR